MPTLNFDRYRKSAGSRNIVIGGVEYTGRPFSVNQFLAYAERAESDSFTDADELRMNVEAVVSRLTDPDGQPIDRDLVEDMSAEELRMVIDFLSTAKTRAKMPDALRDQVEETWAGMRPYLDREFDETSPSTPEKKSTSDSASIGSSESTEPSASPTAA